MITKIVTRILEREEGFRSEPYLCSEGYVTVGYGTKIHKEKYQNPELFLVHVSRSTASEWLQDDLTQLDAGLMRSHVGGDDGIYDGKVGAFPNRRAIILSMGYQMGLRGLLSFNGMWAAIALGDWEGAAREMLDSRWAKQTPERAARHAEVMWYGILAKPYPLIRG